MGAPKKDQPSDEQDTLLPGQKKEPESLEEALRKQAAASVAEVKVDIPAATSPTKKKDLTAVNQPAPKRRMSRRDSLVAAKTRLEEHIVIERRKQEQDPSRRTWAQGLTCFVCTLVLMGLCYAVVKAYVLSQTHDSEIKKQVYYVCAFLTFTCVVFVLCVKKAALSSVKLLFPPAADVNAFNVLW
eukprot:CAMPEP_0175119582 /NCGR_PEP_ID=MMETSP0087-20121206/145_1 /TAXON_ID=136419 /ORGANISM="Unknown Unknown, Strain D1" /LENGTH=184 /DNA_ID=CAMNT_0016400933 /DNA_START=36 /DNA_END=587 /DNA_ORIENTATION=-